MKSHVVTWPRRSGPDKAGPSRPQFEQQLADTEAMDLKALKQRWAELSAHPLPSPLIHSP